MSDNSPAEAAAAAAAAPLRQPIQLLAFDDHDKLERCAEGCAQLSASPGTELVSVVVQANQGEGKSVMLQALSALAGDPVKFESRLSMGHTTVGVFAGVVGNLAFLDVEGCASIGSSQAREGRLDMLAGAVGRVIVACASARFSSDSLQRLLDTVGHSRDLGMPSPHVVLVLRTRVPGFAATPESFLGNCPEALATLRAQSASLEAVLVPEVAPGDWEKVRADDVDAAIDLDAVPAFGEAMRTLSAKVEDAAAAARAAGNATSGPGLAAGIDAAVSALNAENYTVDSLRISLLRGEGRQKIKALTAQATAAAAGIVAAPYGPVGAVGYDAQAAVREIFEEHARAPFAEHLGTLAASGAPSDASLAGDLRRDMENEIATAAFSVVRLVDDAKIAQETAVVGVAAREETAGAQAIGDYAEEQRADWQAVGLADADGEAEDPDLPAAFEAHVGRLRDEALARYDADTLELRTPEKVSARARLTTALDTKAQLVHAATREARNKRESQLATEPGRPRTVRVNAPTNGICGNVAHVFHVPLDSALPDAELSHILRVDFNVSRTNEGTTVYGGSGDVRAVAAEQQVVYSHGGGGKKWHTDTAVFHRSTRTLVVTIASGGWGKCAKHLVKRVNYVDVTVTPNALLGNHLFDDEW